jgi:hypothetical protein
MMIWWNWEKLEMEKNTDTMLMHRSMDRFISSRIKRARVCSVVVQQVLVTSDVTLIVA